MRILCDACESAAAIVFCAADEAALCCSCDEKVHMCNKLASRHVRVGLADPTNAPSCDICENAPAFFYCEIDGSSLCLQCDMVVHVGGKRTHKRFLWMRQRIQFPGDKVVELGSQRKEVISRRNGEESNGATNGERNNGKMDNEMIDLNSNPEKVYEQGIDVNHEPASRVVPIKPFKRKSLQ